jgi:hypothetical protein
LGETVGGGASRVMGPEDAQHARTVNAKATSAQQTTAVRTRRPVQAVVLIVISTESGAC